jgi:hypothetical protein
MLETKEWKTKIEKEKEKEKGKKFRRIISQKEKIFIFFKI